MELYNAGKFLEAQQEFMVLLEKNKNNPEITNPILEKTRDMASCTPQTTASIQWLKEQSNHGNSYAIDFLGDIYYHGNGIERDHRKAFNLFELAAENNSHAQYNLSYMLKRGMGCIIDKGRAQKLLIKSIRAGCAKASVELNSLYDGDFAGLIVENDELKMKNEKLEKIIEQLKKENDELRIELNYRPGGEGYEQAKEHAENIFNQLTNK